MAFDHERAVWELNQLLAQMNDVVCKGFTYADNFDELLQAQEKMARLMALSGAQFITKQHITRQQNG